MLNSHMLLCVRTTIDLPDELFRRAKKAAAAEGVTLREVVVRALAAHLDGQPAGHYEFRWNATEGGTQVVPDEILDSRAALYDYLDALERGRGRD